MSVIEGLLIHLRKGDLGENHVHEAARFVLSKISERRRPQRMTKEQWLESTKLAASMVDRYRDLTAALAVVAVSKYGVSERELSTALGWNRTTLRSRMKDPKVVDVSNRIERVLVKLDVI